MNLRMNLRMMNLKKRHWPRLSASTAATAAAGAVAAVDTVAGVATVAGVDMAADADGEESWPK